MPNDPPTLFDAASLTVTIHGGWKALAVLLAVGYAIGAANWCANKLGDGPEYTPREHLAGFGALASLGAGGALAMTFIQLVGGWWT